MTNPSDPTLLEAAQAEDADHVLSPNWRIHIWQLGGVLLLAGGWLAVSAHEIGSVYFIVDILIFATLGVYGFLAAAVTHKASVNQERKLRLRLLVDNMELQRMATRDHLTQLFNRPYLFDQLERELHRAKDLQRPLAIITIDLDSLRSVNDTYGYRVGDRALANFGRLLLSHTRSADTAARVGGDEFAIMLPDTSKDGAYTIVERLTRGLEKTNLIDEDGLTMPLTASFSISGYPWSGDTVDSIIQHADASMWVSQQGDASSVPAIFRKSLEILDNAPDAEGPQP